MMKCPPILSRPRPRSETATTRVMARDTPGPGRKSPSRLTHVSEDDISSRGHCFQLAKPLPPFSLLPPPRCVSPSLPSHGKGGCVCGYKAEIEPRDRRSNASKCSLLFLFLFPHPLRRRRLSRLKIVLLLHFSTTPFFPSSPNLSAPPLFFSAGLADPTVEVSGQK